MKKKKQNRYIYRVHYQTNKGMGWKVMITKNRMTPSRRQRLGRSLLEELMAESRTINQLVITDVEWINKIG
jgi:hypothetical protein